MVSPPLGLMPDPGSVSPWVVVAGSAVTAGGVLAATIAAQVFSFKSQARQQEFEERRDAARRHEDRADRLREERITAYSDFLTAVEQVAHVIIDGDKSSRLARSVAMSQAAQRVRIVGSLSAGQLCSTLSRIVANVASDETPWPLPEATRAEYQTAYDEFIHAARADTQASDGTITRVVTQQAPAAHR
jgi:hypothetical protein